MELLNERRCRDVIQSASAPVYRGRIDVVSGNRRRDVTTTLSQGRMGAELHFRDQVASQMMADLDQLAYDLATEMNAVHSNYAGLDGVSGRDLFVPPSAVQGAAMSFAVDQAIIDDPTQLASADPNLGSGDNSGLLALADLRDAKLAGSGQSMTFLDEGLRMMTSLGFTVQRAQRDQEVASLRADSLASHRGSRSATRHLHRCNRPSRATCRS